MRSGALAAVTVVGMAIAVSLAGCARPTVPRSPLNGTLLYRLHASRGGPCELWLENQRRGVRERVMRRAWVYSAVSPDTRMLACWGIAQNNVSWAEVRALPGGGRLRTLGPARSLAWISEDRLAYVDESGREYTWTRGGEPVPVDKARTIKDADVARWLASRHRGQIASMRRAIYSRPASEVRSRLPTSDCEVATLYLRAQDIPYPPGIVISQPDQVYVGSSATVSPNGRYLALRLVSPKRSALELWLVDISGGSCRMILGEPNIGPLLSFSSDSKTLLFVRQRNADRSFPQFMLASIWAVRCAGGRPTFIAEGDAPKLIVGADRRLGSGPSPW